MLIHEARGIVDFIVDDEVEILMHSISISPPHQRGKSPKEANCRSDKQRTFFELCSETSE